MNHLRSKLFVTRIFLSMRRPPYFWRTKNFQYSLAVAPDTESLPRMASSAGSLLPTIRSLVSRCSEGSTHNHSVIRGYQLSTSTHLCTMLSTVLRGSSSSDQMCECKKCLQAKVAKSYVGIRYHTLQQSSDTWVLMNEKRFDARSFYQGQGLV